MTQYVHTRKTTC